MATLSIVLLGFSLLVLQTALATLVSMHTFTPNLMLPIVLGLGASGEVPIVRGASIAFLLGYLFDAFCGNPMGLQTFVLVASFMVARGAAFRLLPHGPLSSLLLTFGMTIVTGFAVLSLRAIFEKQSEILTYDLGHTVRLLVQSAATTALASPILFALVRRFAERGGSGEERASLA